MKDYYQLIKSRFKFLLFGLLTIFFANYGQTFFISLFGESIRGEFSLSHAQYGLYYSLATLASGLSILFIGKKLDDISVKRFTTYVCVGFAIACGFMSINQWPLLLVFGFYLLRLCGQGLMGHIAITTMGRFFNKNRGKVVSIVSLGMPIGEAILPAFVILMLSITTWQSVWMMLSASIILIYLPLMLWSLSTHDDTNQQLNYDLINTDSSQSTQLIHFTRQLVLKDYRFYLILPAIVAPGFLVTGVFFHLSHISLIKDWSLQVIASAFVVYGITHMIGSFISGHIVDKHGVIQVLKIYLAPLSLGFLITVLFDHPLSFYIFMVLLGLNVGFAGTVSGTLWPTVYGTRYLASIRAMMTSLSVIATSISPWLFGGLLDLGMSVNALLFLCLVYSAVALLLANLAYGQAIQRPPK